MLTGNTAGPHRLGDRKKPDTRLHTSTACGRTGACLAKGRVSLGKEWWPHTHPETPLGVCTLACFSFSTIF